jgi:hypothetical protein
MSGNFSVPALMTVNNEAAASWQPDRRVRHNFDTTEGEKEWHSGSSATPDEALGFFDFVVRDRRIKTLANGVGDARSWVTH